MQYTYAVYICSFARVWIYMTIHNLMSHGVVHFYMHFLHYMHFLQGRSHADFLVRLKDAMPCRDRAGVLRSVADALHTMGFDVQVCCM